MFPLTLSCGECCGRVVLVTCAIEELGNYDVGELIKMAKLIRSPRPWLGGECGSRL